MARPPRAEAAGEAAAGRKSAAKRAADNTPEPQAKQSRKADEPATWHPPPAVPVPPDETPSVIHGD